MLHRQTFINELFERIDADIKMSLGEVGVHFFVAFFGFDALVRHGHVAHEQQGASRHLIFKCGYKNGGRFHVDGDAAQVAQFLFEVFPVFPHPFVGGVATRDFEYNHDGKIYLLPPFTNLVSVSISDCDDDNLQDIVCDWTPVNKNKQTILNGSCAFGLLRCICNTCESISCCNNKCKILKVEADWASCPMDDLKLVALKMLEQEVKSDDCNKDVKSKTIRSMTVTYKDYEQRDFLSIYKPIIDKWSICHDDVG